MTSPVLAHPRPDVLAAFGAGQLEETASAEIAAHLAQCSTCLSALEELPDDAFITRLRASSGETPEPRPDTASADEPVAVPPALADHPRYRVIGWLGAGGMGTVYKAEHRVMQRPVALKVIDPRLIDKPAAVERFHREVLAAARLTHPNIVTAHDADQAGATHFLVMEFIDGTNLTRLVSERGPLAVATACNYVRQAALGLQHAFEQGMVHRDIKPHNLVLTGASGPTGDLGTIKILDFGLARFVSENAPAEDVTEVGTLMGTPDYIAPEQANDCHGADIRADIYSLGCTLYFLLTGRPPFGGGTALEKLVAHLQRKPMPLTERRQDVPPELARVIERMMAKDPARRYQTPAEVAAALAPFLTSVPRRRTASRLRKRVALAAAAVVLVAVGLAGYVYGPAVYRIATDQGQVVIETDDPDVEVRITQGGEQIQILDAKSKRTINLKAGTYQLALSEGKDGLRLSTDQFTLERGGRQVISVRLEWSRPQVGLKEIRRLEGHIGFVHSLALSGDGRRALTGAWDATVRYWDVDAGRELRCFSRRDGIDQSIYCVAISPDGRRGLAGSRAGTVWFWDLETGTELGRCKIPILESFGPTCLAFSPDGRQALVGGYDGIARVWDTAPWMERKRLEHGKGLWSVCFSPDGRQVLTGGGYKEKGRVCLWDLETGTEVRRFEGLKGGVWRAIFSPGGREILTAHIDSEIYLWDVATRAKRRRFIGHTQGVVSITLTPDGRRLLSGSTDHTMRLWDIRTGEELFRFVERAGEVRVAISPCGDRVLSGTFDGTVRLWQLPPAAK